MLYNRCTKIHINLHPSKVVVMALVESIIKRDKQNRRVFIVTINERIQDVAAMVSLNRMLFTMMPSAFSPDTYEKVDSVLNEFRKNNIPQVVICQDGHLVYFSDSAFEDAIHESTYAWVYNSISKEFERMSDRNFNRFQA